MPLGVVNGTVRIEEHNPAWAGMAKDLIAQLWPILDGYAIDIQHVGSTAIEGIPAKPIIDIAVAVEDVSLAENYVIPLETIDIHYMGEIVDGQRMFCKTTPGKNDRTHHVHIVDIHSERWRDYLNMRDYCNTHSDAAKAYADLKMKLATKYSNERVRYHDEKTALIEAILADAKKWRELQG